MDDVAVMQVASVVSFFVVVADVVVAADFDFFNNLLSIFVVEVDFVVACLLLFVVIGNVVAVVVVIVEILLHARLICKLLLVCGEMAALARKPILLYQQLVVENISCF